MYRTLTVVGLSQLEGCDLNLESRKLLLAESLIGVFLKAVTWKFVFAYSPLVKS